MKIDPGWQLVARRVARIGVLRLWRGPGRHEWYVSLDNRTYHHVFGPIARDKFPRWLKELGR